MKKSILIIGPRSSGKTTLALKIASGHASYFAHPEEVLKDHMLEFIPKGTDKLIVEGCEKLLNDTEKLNTAMTLSWVNGRPAPEIILTSCLRKSDLPEYLVMNQKITLINLWSEETLPQVI
ncbi:MAG: hypothetical protein H7Y13_12035 [Sphingobacteriaceae bacterium]|nr:hypothetical protein [Sphingobacteriaceae bacterium]